MAEEFSTADIDASKPKRGRGRPRNAKSDEAPQPKRPRGRPKKIKTDEEKRIDELVANAFVPPRRGSITKGGLTKSKAIFSKQSVDRLKELDFDPMLGMVNLFYEICEYIDDMQRPDSKRKFSPHALAALVATKQKLLNDLMRYGYNHVEGDKIQNFDGNLIEVILTEQDKLDNKSVYEIEDAETIEDAQTIDN